MNISEISLAKLTDEYILHIEGMEDLNPAEMADFLVVAARLLWIKSKTLLPTLETGVDEAGDLAQQLKIYKEYKDASIVVGKMIAKNNFTYTRDKLPLGAGDSFFNPPAWLSKEKICRSLLAKYAFKLWLKVSGCCLFSEVMALTVPEKSEI